MIALADMDKDKTYTIIGYNIKRNDESNRYELWVTCDDKVGRKVMSSTSKKTITEYKDMIDTAVEKGEYLVRIGGVK